MDINKLGLRLLGLFFGQIGQKLICQRWGGWGGWCLKKFQFVC